MKYYKSVKINDISELEAVYNEMFKTGNYCIVCFDIGFFCVDNRRVRGAFQRNATQRLEEIGDEKNIKYVEFPIENRNGTDLLNIFYEAINETKSVAFAHDREKAMYLYVSEKNVEDIVDLSKKYRLQENQLGETPFSWK